MNAFTPPPTADSGFRQDLARWRQLVAPCWLAGLLAGERVEAAPEGHWCLLEVGCALEAQFELSHIPGARYLDTSALEAPPFFNKVDDHVLLALLLANGIRHDTTVVLYGRSTLAAARAAHLLLYAGVCDVRLLDAGLSGWCAAALPCASGPAAAAAPAPDFGCAFPARPAYMANTRQATRILAQHDAALVSIRTWSEFSGATSGYSYIDARGEIPGARWGRAGSEGDVNSMSEYQHADGRMRGAGDIERIWRAAGIVPSRQATFYCGTGWRASLAFFYAWLMGWERISVYDGGWLEWSADPANPIVCRAAEQKSA